MAKAVDLSCKRGRSESTAPGSTEAFCDERMEFMKRARVYVTSSLATPSGRRAVRRWLEEPVDHLREMRSLFLFKLVLAEGSGQERKAPIEAHDCGACPF